MWRQRYLRSCARAQRLQSHFRSSRRKAIWCCPVVTLHLLDDVNQNVSATAIRQAIAAKKPIRKFVPESVEEYIKKEGLYGIG